MWFSKLNKLFKKDQTEFEKIKTMLFSHYLRLINIFDFYSGQSDYPVISMNDVTNFSHQVSILGTTHIKLADMDLELIATNVPHHNYLKAEERNLQRYEFIEFLVRISLKRYVDPPNKFMTDRVAAIEKLFERKFSANLPARLL